MDRCRCRKGYSSRNKLIESFSCIWKNFVSMSLHFYPSLKHPMVFFMTDLNLDWSHSKLKDAVQLFVHKYETIIAGSTFIQYPWVTMVTQPHGLKNCTEPAFMKKPHAVILDLRDQLREEGEGRISLNPRIYSTFFFNAFSFRVININYSYYSNFHVFLTPM